MTTVARMMDARVLAVMSAKKLARFFSAMALEYSTRFAMPVIRRLACVLVSSSFSN
jgi:hypothetical protein